MNIFEKKNTESTTITDKEQSRKDFALISKAENEVFKNYEKIRNFDTAIKMIKAGIVLNKTRRPLYLKILKDLNNHHSNINSLGDVKYQILKSIKAFKETEIPSDWDIRRVELRRINKAVNDVISGVRLQEKIADARNKSQKKGQPSEGNNAPKGNINAPEGVKLNNNLGINVESALRNRDFSLLYNIFSPKNITDLKNCLSKIKKGSPFEEQFITKIMGQLPPNKSINIDINSIYDGLNGKLRAEITKVNLAKKRNNAIEAAKKNAEVTRTDNKKKGGTGRESEHLNERNENLRKYLTTWSEQDTEIGSEGLTLKQAFLIQNKAWLESLNKITDVELEKKYSDWNKNRLNNIKQVLNFDDLLAYATRKQLAIADFDRTTTQNFSEWIKSHPNIDSNEDKESQNIMKFLGFTQGELVGELLKNVDINTKEGLKLLQVLSLSTAKGTRLFDDEHLTGYWNAETQYFLEIALKDPTFQKSDTTGEYSRKIREVLNSHRHFDTSYLDQDFQTLSEVQNREQEFIKNPNAIWQSQTLEGPREFVGISDLGYGNSYKLGEQEFLNSHMQGFNGKLAEFLNLSQIKEGVPIDETSRIKMEQIWKTIPLEQINAIYNLFASKPEEQEKFNNFLKDNNLPNIDINDVSLKRSVLEQDFSFNPIAKYCYERIWFSCQNEIISESGKTLQYLSDKTGDTALNIKNKVLEFFLPGISIRPEKAENGIFYFRDENNLDTLYSFNPENGEISQQGNISLEDEGIISFRSGGSKGNLLQKIQGFQNIVDIDLLDILPDKNPGNMEELENQILNKIQSKIAVEKVADTSVVNKELLRLKNERNVCYNGIVGDLKQLLNIEDDYLYETSGENYKIFFNLLKTFERIDIEYPNDNKPLISMKLLLDKICDSTGSFTLLKPSLLDNNGEPTEENPGENTDGEIQNSQKVARGPYIIKNLINPNTQLFDVDLINDLSNNGGIDQYLAERKYDRIIAEIQKNRELKIAEQEYEKEVAQLHNSTRDELHGLNEDIELFANISALENEGDFLS